MAAHPTSCRQAHIALRYLQMRPALVVVDFEVVIQERQAVYGSPPSDRNLVYKCGYQVSTYNLFDLLYSVRNILWFPVLLNI